jgi:spore photoproduct lyase
LYAGPLAETNGMVSYREDLEHEITGFCRQELLNFIPASRLFCCSAAA